MARGVELKKRLWGAAPNAPCLLPRRTWSGVTFALVLLLSGAARAEDCGLPPVGGTLQPAAHFSFSGKFGQPGDTKKQRRKDSKEISGIACAAPRTEGGARTCVLATDNVRYAHLLQFRGDVLDLGATRKLLRRREDGVAMDELDAEGVAYDGTNGRDYFYVTGSHGTTRFGHAYQPSRYRVFRLPYDPATGEVGPREASVGLEDIIREEHALAATACQRGKKHCTPLDENGTNIEGIAAKDDALFFGFRAPTHDGTAYVLKVPAGRLFERSAEAAELKPVRLGRDCGVRDIAAIKDGFLILAGVDASEKKGLAYRSYVQFWDGVSESVTPLGSLPSSDVMGKPEALLVLSEDTQGRAFRVLVLSDGTPEGNPTVYEVRRP